MVTLLPEPVSDTVLAPAVSVDPAPLVFQFPLTVHDPLVIVMDPETPPVIVTLPTVTAAALALTEPPFPTVRLVRVRVAAPVAVSVAVTTGALTLSVPVEMVIVPPAWVNAPVLWKVKVEIANVPENPVLS